jgi:predicted transcriptional regulator
MSRSINNPEIVKLAVCSDLRKNILISLNEGDKSLGDLRERLEISSTTAIHALRDLEKHRLTQQGPDRKYALTNIGNIIALKLMDFSDLAEVITKHERFWLEHDISGIPEHLIMKMGCLKEATLLESHATDIFKVHAAYIDLVSRAKEIKGVSPIFVPEFSSIFKTIVENKIDVQLIVTEKVLEKIDKNILENILSNENAKLKVYMLKEDVKVAVTVTDYFFSLGFFHFDGTYDWNKDLISYDKKGIDWGRKLFQWYLKKVELLNVDD